MSQHDQIAKAYKKYGQSEVMSQIAKVAHGVHYCQQTSSATLDEIMTQVKKWPQSADGALLDAGCGNGCFSIPLSIALNKKMWGIDLAPDLIEIAQQKSRSELAHFRVGDYGSLSSEIQNLSGIMCIGSMYWNLNLDATFKCWHERLNEEGRLLIFINACSTPLSEEQIKRAGETSFFLEGDFLKHLSAHFTLTQVEEKNATYCLWLEKWLEGMSLYRDELVSDFGEKKADAMQTRFEAYLEFAKSGKTKRLVIEGVKKT